MYSSSSTYAQIDLVVADSIGSDQFILSPSTGKLITKTIGFLLMTFPRIKPKYSDYLSGVNFELYTI